MVWEDKGAIYHAWRDRNGQWHAPRKLFYGYTPSIALDGNEHLHLVFSQNVTGNFEIYHIVFNGSYWSLPINISHTRGASYSPQIAQAPDGTLHVVWNDNTPGRDVIYQAVLDANGLWVDAPLPGAWGKAPSLQIDPSLIAYVLWQGSNQARTTDVFYMDGKGHAWQLPRNLSDSSTASVGIHAVLDSLGQIHAVWTESAGGTYYVRYTSGRRNSWLRPQTLAEAGGESAAIATSERGAYVHVWWSDGRRWWETWRGAVADQWAPPAPLTQVTSQQMVFRFAPQNDSRLRAFWRVDTPTGAEVWYGEARTPIVQRLYFPRVGQAVPHSRVAHP